MLHLMGNDAGKGIVEGAWPILRGVGYCEESPRQMKVEAFCLMTIARLVYSAAQNMIE